MNTTEWHRQNIEEVMAGLGSAKKGLSVEEATQRLKRYGPNELQEKKRKSPFVMFLDQFRDFMILILIGAAVIAGFIGELSDTIAIVVIVILNAVIGFVQEYRAEKAIEALQKMAGSTATVLRAGMPMTVPAAEIVPGDIVVLEARNIVPANLRLFEAVNLKIEEAALTGESVPVEKHTDLLSSEDLPLGDRKNMSYRGTYVTYGRAKGVVAATGMLTELGKIADMLQSAGEIKTPLAEEIDCVRAEACNRRPRHLRHRLYGRCNPGRGAAPDAPHRHFTGRCRDPRSASGSRHHLSGDWGEKTGAAERPDQKTPFRGNARGDKGADKGVTVDKGVKSAVGF